MPPKDMCKETTDATDTKGNDFEDYYQKSGEKVSEFHQILSVNGGRICSRIFG